jgi:hypothetical protein
MLKIIAASALLAALTSLALAHGPAAWIGDNQIRNIAGSLCCGENDCGLYSSKDPADGTIEMVAGGYKVDAVFRGINKAGSHFSFRITAFVPFAEAMVSPTGDYWACAWGGQLRCFFAPPPGT